MDFSAQLVHHYPKLRDGGGYELLHMHVLKQDLAKPLSTLDLCKKICV